MTGLKQDIAVLRFSHAGGTGFESPLVSYFFCLFFIVFTRLGIRLGLGLVFLG